jgi:Predicted divalent heavy-metal cations transporter
MEIKNIAFALLMSTVAGLSTGVGGIIAFSAKKTNVKFLSVSLGFSAGVMVFISLVELYPSARDMLSTLGAFWGELAAVAAFFAGILFMGFIERVLPSENSDNMKAAAEEPGMAASAKRKRLLKTGAITAIALSLHNLPEGMVTFVSALQGPKMAYSIVAAVAIHNIPEGIAVSAPIYYATGSRKKAFVYSLVSGLAEPAGALIGFLLLRPFLNDIFFGLLYSFVAGIMIFISLDELMPKAREYGNHHVAICGLFAGMFVLAISLAMLK